MQNDVLWNAKVWLVSNIVQRIVRECQLRIKLVIPKKMSIAEEEWIMNLCTK